MSHGIDSITDSAIRHLLRGADTSSDPEKWDIPLEREPIVLLFLAEEPSGPVRASLQYWRARVHQRIYFDTSTTDAERRVALFHLLAIDQVERWYAKGGGN